MCRETTLHIISIINENRGGILNKCCSKRRLYRVTGLESVASGVRHEDRQERRQWWEEERAGAQLTEHIIDVLKVMHDMNCELYTIKVHRQHNSIYCA